MTPTTRTRTALGALAAALLLTLTACGGSGSDSGSDSGSGSDSSSASPSESGSAGPSLKGIPDVVAEVNGEELSKDDFVPVYLASVKAAEAQAQAGGDEPDEDALRAQALDELVDTELLAQEADARGLEVSDEDVDAELDRLADQNGMTSKELLAAVAAQGLDEEQARDQVETQVMVEQLVADENGPVKPTEKELRALYAQVKAQAQQSGQDVPAFAAARDQLVEQATVQETGEIAQALLKDLRAAAEITRNL